MKPQHTPGPWRVGQRHSGDKIEIRDTAGTLIGWAYGASSIVKLDPEANARLLAAAPELFDALRAVSPLLPEDTQQAIEVLITRIEGDSQ